MRILLLHPDDDLAKIAGVERSFDVVFDLGYAGPNSYQRWSERIGCAVKPVPQLEFVDLRTVGEAFESALGGLIDNFGFDWWDLISVSFYEQMLEAIRLDRFIQNCGPNDEISLRGNTFHARVLHCLLPGGVHEFARSVSFPQRLGSRVEKMLGMRPRQLVEILGDKYDGSYRFRRLTAAARNGGINPVILIPSGYGNASSVALGYAGLLPDQKFLLVATRHSGSATKLPDNVAAAGLASYVPAKFSRAEFQGLLSRWHRAVHDLQRRRQLSILWRAGCFDSVPGILRSGLSIRDAWLQVFDSERVSAVLCADEMNWHTRLPLLIARSRGLPTVACHHGAFDLRYAFRETNADRLLAKGAMEENYLAQICGLPASRIEVAAPARAGRPRSNAARTKYRRSVVFFSEPYENFGSRCSEVYREVLPPLAELADRNGCELVVKLHPFESLRTRKRLAVSVLSSRHRALLRVVDGPLADELIEAAWIGVTITSTAALDCALKRIPAFLCEWLDCSNSMYGKQFVKFGVAKALPHREAISEIPHMLKQFPVVDLSKLWRTVRPDRLRKLLSGAVNNQSPKEGVQSAERVWA